MKEQQHNNDIYDLCKQHMHAYVLAETVDGNQVDGIVTGLDHENVYFAVPIDSAEQIYNQYEEFDYRQFGYGYGYPGYGYPGYGYGYPGYGYGYPRRRFQRLVLPLAAITALSLLPWY